MPPLASLRNVLANFLNALVAFYVLSKVQSTGRGEAAGQFANDILDVDWENALRCS